MQTIGNKGGRGYLLANPGQGIGVLLSFAVFSFVASRATDRRSPLYAAIILAEIAYHLFLYRQGMDALSYGVWSLAPLALLTLVVMLALLVLLALPRYWRF